MRSLDYAHLIMSAEPPFNLSRQREKTCPEGFYVHFLLLVQKKMNERKRIPPVAGRKFLTSRANPSADDFVSPASLRACTTKSFTASIDGTKFSQGGFDAFVRGQTDPRESGGRRCAVRE